MDLPAPLDAPATALFAGGLTLGLSAVGYYGHKRRATAGMLAMWHRKSRRSAGVASTVDIWRATRRIQRKATILRPSLADLSRRDQRRALAQYASPLVTVGGLQLGRRILGGVRVWSSCEDVTGVFGGPRMGKSQLVACEVVDAPGACLVTSTRTDLLELTATLRARRGPVHIWNPGGLRNDQDQTIASTLKWSPLTGCRNAAVAMRRAADMIPEGGDAKGERWDDQARDALAVLMHAAALADLPMRAVMSWIADPRPDTSGREVEHALRRSPEWETMQHSARQFFGLDKAPKTSVTMTMRPAVRWLRDSRAAAAGDAAGEDQVDIAELLAQNATIYLLGEEDGVVGPLVAALTAEIARQARLMASGRPGGRLDPPLTLALDEAGIICRVPLQRWTADMGGRGVKIILSFQSLSQLVDKWGSTGAETILGNCGTLVVFGGGANLTDYQTWSALAGTREVRYENLDGDGKVSGFSIRREPVIEPATIANLPEGVVFVKRKGIWPAIGRSAAAWRRTDILTAPKYQAPVETTYADRGLDDDAA